MQQDVEVGSNDRGELENWLKLVQIPNFSVTSLKKLEKKCDVGLSELFTTSPALLEKMGFNSQQINAVLKPNTQAIQASLDWLSAAKNRFLIHFDHPIYPDLLKQISSPPPLLYGYGDPKHLRNYQIAMVGSRNPSPQGKENAKFFSPQITASSTKQFISLILPS